MFMALNHIHLIGLWVSSEKTHLEILVFYHLLYYILLHSFALLLFLSLVHLLAVKFWPQSSKPYADLSTCFIFHHSHHFLIVATWNARTVNYRIVTCDKLIFNITTYILEVVFSFNTITETVSVCEEKLCSSSISIFWFDVIVMEIIRLTLADIRILILQYTSLSNMSFVSFVWIVKRFTWNIV